MDTLILNVVGILPEAIDTATIFLERADGLPLDYQAGQFLTFLFDFHGRSASGRELRRSYSLSSAPGVDPIPSITVKRVTNGEASRYLLDHLRVGDQLRSLPPAGRFLLEKRPAATADAMAGMPGPGGRVLFFIAAGSGVVPIFSLLKKALAEEPGTRIVLISQHHDDGSIPFFKKLEELERDNKKRFRWVNLRSAKDGRLNNWWLEELLGELLLEVPPGGAGKSTASRADMLPGYSHPAFYLCGPPAFMRMAQFTLRVMGFTYSYIRKENFTVEFVPPPPLLTDPSPKKITIRAGGKTYQYEAAWPATILQAGLDRQIPLPYSCKGGRCSTCVARCINGKVKMSINEVLTEKDLQEGLVLTCVGYAETDVELVL